MTPRQVEMHVKRVISRATGRPISLIRYAHSLKDEYRFNAMGKQTLAPSLNGEFSDHGTPIAPPLGPTETQAAETVGDLAKTIRERFGI